MRKTQTQIERDFAKLRRRVEVECRRDDRAALRRDKPRDRYAIWCAERAGVALPVEAVWHSATTLACKIAFFQRGDGSVDDIAIFYTGTLPYARSARDPDDYAEIARVIIPNARWEPGPVLDLSEPEEPQLLAA